MKLHRHSPLRGLRKHQILSEGFYLFDFSSTPARVRRNMSAAIPVIAARHDSVEFPDGQDCAPDMFESGTRTTQVGTRERTKGLDTTTGVEREQTKLDQTNNDRHLPQRGAAVYRQADRARKELRGAGRHRHRKRTAAQRASRVASAADSHRRRT